MAFEAGNVVMLKSGGQPMTVVSSSDNDVECIWIGEEGEFFRHTIPAIAVVAVELDDEDENEDESEDGEDEEEAPKAKRSAA